MFKFMFISFLSLFMTLQAAVGATTCKRPPLSYTKHGLTSSQYQAAFNNFSGRKKLSVTDISVTTYKGKTRFSAIWEKRPYKFVTSHGLTSKKYQAYFNKYTKLGYRLTDISGYQAGNSIRYAVVFEKKGGAGWLSKSGMTNSQYQKFFNESTKKGYRLTFIDGFSYKGQSRYSAIFEKKSGPSYRAKHGMTSSQYQSSFSSYAKKGYYISLVSGHSLGGKPRFAAIWEKKGSGPSYHNLSAYGLQSRFTNLHYKGYKLKGISAYSDNGKARYVGIWKSFGAKSATQRKIDAALKAHMKKYKLPGVSIAITKDECLVYASGYGNADIERKKPAHALNLFRVASVSKPLTTLGIMKLIGQGKFTMDDTVFGPGALLGTKYGKWPYKSGIVDITVRNLLEHTSGWSNDGGDVMFKGELKNHAQIMAFMLNKRGLKRMAGADDEYLNFGYTVLGRVIEKFSGQSYENYLRNKIFRPAGISTMRLGDRKQSKARPGEAKYYPSSSYNLRPRIMDAHGGWIASAVDLTRLMVKVDRLKKKRDILSASSIDAMLVPSAANNGYAKGFIVGNGAGHNGEMRGSGAFWWRTNNGFSWSILMNKRPSGDAGSFKARNMMNKLVKEITNWSSYDLF